MNENIDCVAEHLPQGANLIVAFASLEGDMVDQHFGSAQGFFVYDVTADAATLIASKKFAREAKDGNEDKLKPKLQWLVGSDVVYCGSIGGSATRQLVSLGITPKKVTGGPDVDELIEELQEQLDGEPEFWLANVMKQKQKQTAGASRFDDADDEDWG
ncbi:NifB/NifX family molybdenum-iron cluster-binding protein [Teredinibacter turnerae]|uniref:NifB/NifX family molybdenum-iron cluster-binding protein n=1 Tax=Teredinibacter turnerae TaxID=2426 RepID=UPI00036CA39C|nr:NifB/NifX family molybdenum-iron cluster-binding protein [Teredinibacter turnerae]